MKTKKSVLLVVVLLLTLAFRVSSDGNIFHDGDVPLPPDEDYGVMCLVEFENVIVASAPNVITFTSQDGGLTWQQVDSDMLDISGSDCTPGIILQKDLWATPVGSIRYRFEVGQTIEVSDDQGLSWQLVYDLSNVVWEPVNTPEPDRQMIVQPGPLDAMIDPKSGNLLLAMGHAGVLVRLCSGEWRWVDVGPYASTAKTPTPTTMGEEMQCEELIPQNFEQLTPTFEIDTENNYVDAMAFSPDGTQLAISGFDGGIKLFNFPEGELQDWLGWGADDCYDRLYGAVFSRDGKTLCTCGTNVDQTLRFWDIESRELINHYEGFQTSALDAGRITDEQYFAVRLGSQAKIFHLPEGEEVGLIDSHLNYSIISDLFFIPETNLLAIGRTEGGVELWNFDQRRVIFLLQGDYEIDERKSLYRNIISMGYDPSEGVLLALLRNGRLNAWHISTGELAWELVLPVPHGWLINTGAFSEDGRLAAVGMHNGTLIVIDSQSGKTLTRQWIKDGGTLQQLDFSPDGQWLAAGFTTGKVKVWHVDVLIN